MERVSGFGPIAVVRDAHGQVSGLELKRCLRVYDAERRFSPVFDERDPEILTCDTVLIAAGQATDLSFLGQGGEDVLQFRPGWPKVDPDTLQSTAPGVFVAGDLAHGTRLIIDAVASGKRAARSVYTHLTGRALSAEATTAHVVLDRYRREIGYERIQRLEVATSPPAERLGDPHAQVEIGLSAEEAAREASRCLDCGVTPVFDSTRCVLCGGCADVCPTLCLKLVPLSDLEETPDSCADASQGSAILKDEDRCIRCALCAMRCPVDAITMERITFQTTWRQP